ncbi:MAG: hypothetical protein ACI8PZ_005586 [Myxococcota bacterium]|jgi:hypothetical protein
MLVLIAVALLSVFDAPAPPEHTYAGLLVATDRPEARGLFDGDVVFQRSTSSQSDAIRAATGSPWTHVGLICEIECAPWVLEAVQPVRLTPFEAWRARGEGGEVRVRRWAEPVWTPSALARLDALQARWLGRPYDVQFAPGEDALYCSELVREAYLQAVDVELAPLRPVSEYAVDDPGLRARMVRRWGTVPEALRSWCRPICWRRRAGCRSSPEGSLMEVAEPSGELQAKGQVEPGAHFTLPCRMLVSAPVRHG